MLFGDNGDDLIFGTFGDDSLFGGRGDDFSGDVEFFEDLGEAAH